TEVLKESAIAIPSTPKAVGCSSRSRLIYNSPDLSVFAGLAGRDSFSGRLVVLAVAISPILGIAEPLLFLGRLCGLCRHGFRIYKSFGSTTRTDSLVFDGTALFALSINTTFIVAFLAYF
ncbi:hypothetical protein, partial [Brucella lupini]